MKKLLPFVLMAVVLLSACKKDRDNEPARPSLSATFTDGYNNPIGEAEVRLYRSVNDCKNNTNQIGETLYTDRDGNVCFYNLPDGDYNISAHRECLTNEYGIQRKGTYVYLDNNKPEVRLVMYETSTVTLQNKSGKHFSMRIDGVYAETAILPGSTSTFYFLTGNEHDVMISTSDWSVIRNFDVKPECGKEDVLQFP